MPARRTKYFTLWMQEISRSGSDLRKAAMEEGNADREAHGYKPYTSQGRLPEIQNQSTDLGELPRAYRKQGFFRR